MKKTIASIVLVSACVATGCEPAPTEETITEWMGPAPHFAAKGFLNGADVDLSLGEEEASDEDRLLCDRDYLGPFVDGEPDLAKARPTGFLIKGSQDIAGETVKFEVNVKAPTAAGAAEGTEIVIVPAVEGEELADEEMWLVWGFENEEGVDYFEEYAQDGMFEVGQYTGTPEEGTSVIPGGEGRVGGFASARWSADEYVSVSFSAICVRNSFSELQQ